MIKLLELEGWNGIDRIVQFQCDSKKWYEDSEIFPNPNIRLMTKKDIQYVHSIDIISFQPLWEQSKDSFLASYEQSGYATVYFEGQRILGFQISTIKEKKAHLARIAVHPNYRRHHIGEFLAKDLLMHALRKNITNISVNTRFSNNCSIALYRKMNFVNTGNSFPIFSYEQ